MDGQDMQGLFAEMGRLLQGRNRRPLLHPDITKARQDFLKALKAKTDTLDLLYDQARETFKHAPPLSQAQTEQFLPHIERNIRSLVRAGIKEYRHILTHHEHIEEASKRAKEHPDEMPADVLEEVVYDAQQRLLDAIVNSYLHLEQELPRALEETCKSIELYNRYLQDKFIPSEDEDKGPTLIRLVGKENARLAEYTKIQFIDDNPILTDLLLCFADALPSYRKRRVKEGDEMKIVKELSVHALGRVADRMMAFASDEALESVHNPTGYLRVIGALANQFVDTHEDLGRYVEDILNNPTLLLLGNSPQQDPEKREENAQARERHLAQLEDVDLEDIVQHEDDYLPDNRKEKDHFELREKLLTYLRDLLYELKDMNPQDLRKRREHAKKRLQEAVEIKDQIDDILAPEGLRQLREDRRTDNEYYQLKQGDIGMVSFERAPTPNTKLESVIGKSFDTAKEHLMQIIRTGTTPKVIQLSAPGRKVRSNILLIGPYGCGKTELARAICADERVIGASVSVAGTLTAYMHESVNNVKRIYTAAKQLYLDAREQKPVVLVLDEFDSWFTNEQGGHSYKDMEQIKNTLQEILDGMGDYNGVITLAMTNFPQRVPAGIMRRFRYVDIVGELDEQERIVLLKQSLETSLPLADDVAEHYQEWAAKLKDAPGDVIRKVVDELHFKRVPAFIDQNRERAEELENALKERQNEKGKLGEEDVTYLRGELAKHFTISAQEITYALDEVIERPAIQQQISKARELYENAQQIREDLGMGWKRGNTLFR